MYAGDDVIWFLIQKNFPEDILKDINSRCYRNRFLSLFGTQYDAHFQLDPGNRTHLFWSSELSSLLRNTFPELFKQAQEDTYPEVNRPSLRFQAVGSSRSIFEIQFIDPTAEELDDVNFQNHLSNVSLIYTADSPQLKPQPKTTGNRIVWPRDPGISKGAIEKAEYLCENNPDHNTFTSKTTTRNYVEAHHLIPMKLQDSFSNGLDVTANILSLCPNCHDLFHYGNDDEKFVVLEKFYLEKFYNERKDSTAKTPKSCKTSRINRLRYRSNK